MSAISVPSANAVKVPNGWDTVQNLSAGDVWMDVDNTASSTTGVKLAAGQSFSKTNWPYPELWLRSGTGTADVRFIAPKTTATYSA